MSTAELPTCYRHPDRPTGLSCSECERPICVDCMVSTPVGIRCPDHATVRGSARRQVAPRVRVPRAPLRAGATQALVTKILIAINVLVYLITVVQGGGGINNPGGHLFREFELLGHLPAGVPPEAWPYGTVASGDWWRLFTAAFLHANLIHLGFNMLALWWIGGPVEEYLGRTRYVMLYIVSGLAGAAGALIHTPTTPVVGASGAIFGILGAMMVLEYQATGRLGGYALTLVVVNLAIGLVYNQTGGLISIGGHIGGLIGGILGTLAFARFGRGHAAYGRLGLTGAAGLVLVGVASIAIAYWQVRGYTY
jgi:membrane associated rhomboid family serine protease